MPNNENSSNYESNKQIPLEEIPTDALETIRKDLSEQMAEIKRNVHSPGVNGKYWSLVAENHKIYNVLEARKRRNNLSEFERSTGEV